MKKSILNTEIFFLVFLLVFVTSCSGQDKPSSLKENQPITETLPFANTMIWKLDSSPQIAEYVVEIFEDKKGNLWFGTMGKGAARYDGKSFTHFTKKDGLCSNNVNSIIEDRKGNIWFTSIPSSTPEDIREGGVSLYDGTTFTNYPAQ